jgi:hypothetical protein
MNEQIKKLVDVTAEMIPGVYSLKYEDGGSGVEFSEEALGVFANLIIEEHIKLLRRTWYERNNEEYPKDMSPRDIGVKVGRKNEIVVLIEKIKQYWNI